MDLVRNILEYIFYLSEGFAALTALYFIKSVKEKTWKFFTAYLVIIFVLDLFGRFGYVLFEFSKMYYYNYLVIPLQFIFFFWLYTVRFSNGKLYFYSLTFLYLVSFLPSELYFSKSTIINSFNYTFGCFLLLVLIVSEYYRQLYADDILYFRKNRMFYINLGVTLFYIGTLPFYTFYKILYSEYPSLWLTYCSYAQISDILMYLLFSASFIWGKQNF